MIRPFFQKYWYAFMIGEPFDLKPSTSSRELPPDQTVAPKESTSVDVVQRRKLTTLMPHDGSGDRSGSDDAGGLLRVGTLTGSSPKPAFYTLRRAGYT